MCLYLPHQGLEVLTRAARCTVSFVLGARNIRGACIWLQAVLQRHRHCILWRLPRAVRIVVRMPHY
jgi:hypothetical protein